MKITVLSVGRKDESKYKEAIEDFTERSKHYFDVEWLLIKSASNTSAPIDTQKIEEGASILKSIKQDDFVVLLDERGNTITTEVFSELLQKHLSRATKHIVFVIGGAFGVSEDVLVRANFTLAFGKMVFPHGLMRLLIIEQIYRAGTILRGEKYHHK